MKLDREQAVRLFNLITVGHPVGVGNDGEIVTSNTELGTALHVLGLPSYITQKRLPNGERRTVVMPSGQKYSTDRDWDTTNAVAFLRHWADALEGKNADV